MALIRRYRRLFAIAAVVIPVLIFTPVTMHWVHGGDYTMHFSAAFSLLKHHPVSALINQQLRINATSYPLYHLVFLAYWTTFFSIFQQMVSIGDQTERLIANTVTAGTLANLTFHVIMSLSLYYLLFNTLSKRAAPLKAAVISIALTAGLLLVTAINFTIPLDGKHYFGFISLTPQHNPTVIAVKPFALLLCVYSLSLLQAEDRFQPKLVAAAFILTVLTNLAKPTYAICILPVLMIFTLPVMLRKAWRKFAMLMLGVFLPMLICLGWQYLITYGDLSRGGIIWSPFSLVNMYSSFIAVKFILSILFPAVVYLAFFPLARRSFALNFSWLVFGVSACYFYLFAESGNRFTDGNMGWGAMTALFIVFFYSVVFLIEHWDTIWKSPKQRLTYQLCWVLFLVHVCNGIAWFNYLVHNTKYS